MREQSVINCKTIFVVTGLGFGALIISQVKKVTATRNFFVVVVFLVIPYYLNKEM